MPRIALAERRHTPRYPSSGLIVALRVKGKLTWLEGFATDFNRYGLSIVLDHPLPKEKTVFTRLTCRHLVIDNVVGVIHSCFASADGFRCGIQFRTNSVMQLDQRAVAKKLILIEEALNPNRRCD